MRFTNHRTITSVAIAFLAIMAIPAARGATIATPPLEMNIFGGVLDYNLLQEEAYNYGLCAVLNGDDEPITVLVEIFDSGGNIHVSEEINVPAHSVRDVESRNHLAFNLWDHADRGFCRVSGKFKKRATKATLSQCFFSTAIPFDEQGCEASVSTR